MATVFLSDQVTKIESIPTKKVSTTELAGRVRVAFFTKTLPASGLAIGDTIRLGSLPKGARLLGGEFCWDATQGATATTAIGVSGAAGQYFAAAVTASAAWFPIMNTQALKYGSVLAAETELLVTNAAAAWTASSVFMLKVFYVVD